MRRESRSGILATIHDILPTDPGQIEHISHGRSVHIWTEVINIGFLFKYSDFPLQLMMDPVGNPQIQNSQLQF